MKLKLKRKQAFVLSVLLLTGVYTYLILHGIRLLFRQQPPSLQHPIIKALVYLPYHLLNFFKTSRTEEHLDFYAIMSIIVELAVIGFILAWLTVFSLRKLYDLSRKRSKTIAEDEDFLK